MKGIIFNLLEDVVTAQHGEVLWDALLDRANLDGAYTSLGNYPDAELARLMDEAAADTNLAPAEMPRWFGRLSMPFIERRYPGLFEAHAETRSFLLALNAIHETEVRKLYPGARCPVFDYGGVEGDPDGALLLGYRSPRRLCMFAHGLIEGAAAHFREHVSVAHRGCMHRGDPHCTLEVRFAHA